jgi:parallel beta-helix repeat protein
MLTLLFNVQPVEASGTIYIRADGSIDPPTAPISTVDNVTYTFTADIYDSIVVQRDNIVVDGAGYTVQGTGSGAGIDLGYRNNVTLKNVEVTNFDYGIYLSGSDNNVIAGNIVLNNGHGIYLSSSRNNVLTGNNVSLNDGNGIALSSSSGNVLTGNNVSSNQWAGIWLSYSGNNVLTSNAVSNNGYGIWLSDSYNNVLTGNIALNNGYGIWLWDSGNNVLFHNNLVNNIFSQAVVTAGYVNTWDNGYPFGGNYWSDYNGTDFYSGPYQNETGSDGIGDTPYIIDADNRDNYPLMNPMGSPQPPIAVFTYIPEHPVIGETATFNATSSYDRDGSVISYEWNFGDGNITTMTTPIITHVYAAQDTYTVNLTVTDDDGFTHSTTKSITIEKISSTITINVGPATVTVGSNVTINGTITPIKVGVDVTISYKPPSGTWTTLTTVKTDSNSYYTYAWKTTEEGIYEIKASWQGDENTLPAESETKIVMVDSTPPTIGIPFRTPEGDILPDQSVKVSVNVTDAVSGVKNVTLSYTINNGTTWENLPMNYNASTSLYEATIPSHPAGTWVKYKIIAYDNAENPATKDGTEPYYTYQVIPEFPSAITLPLLMVLTMLALAFTKRKVAQKNRHLIPNRFTTTL